MSTIHEKNWTTGYQEYEGHLWNEYFTNTTYIWCYAYHSPTDCWYKLPRSHFSYLWSEGLWQKGEIELPKGKMLIHKNRERYDDRPENLKLWDEDEIGCRWESEECLPRGQGRYNPPTEEDMKQNDY